MGCPSPVAARQQLQLCFVGENQYSERVLRLQVNVLLYSGTSCFGGR